MARFYLTLPLFLALLTGCTLSAKANPALDSVVSTPPEATATVAPVVAPAEAATERLASVLGASGSSSIAAITATDGAVTVTLLTAPSTLGGAEEYWTVCGALTPLLGSSTVTSLAVAAPDGRPVVGASVTTPSCVLLASR